MTGLSGKPHLVAKTRNNKNIIAGQDRRLIARLWRVYVRPYLGTLLRAFIFMIVVAAATAAYTWLLKFIVDTMAASAENNAQDATSNATQFIKIIVPAVIGLTAVSGISLFVQSVLTNKVALSVVGDLQKSMFKSLQGTDYAELSSKPVGTYVSHFTNDVNLVAQGLLRTMNNLGRDLLTLVFLIGAMFWHNWQMSLVILLVYPIAIYPILLISKRIRGSSHAAQDQMGKINALLNESLHGTRMVRTYGLEQYEEKRLGTAFDQRIRLYLKLVTNQARVDPIMEILAGIAIAGVFAFGVFQMSNKNATGGDLVAVLTALGLAAPKVRALGTLNNVIQESLAALKRIFGVIDTPAAITDAPDAHTLTTNAADIKFTQVNFAYADGTQAINDISFNVARGQTIALVGPSGGGKSTIINLIARLYDVSSGRIEIGGRDIRSVTLESLRNTIALVSQDVTLFDDTVAVNIGFGRKDADMDAIKAAAKAAAADGFIKALKDGYQTRVGEGGGTLSGGQRQRIALARAILRDAPILLLDEATSALDAQAEATIQTALDTLSRNRTVIVIAHRLSTVKNADRILVLEHGKIAERGTHSELMEKAGLYAKLRALQFS